MRDLMLVGLGGFMGAVARYLVSGATHLVLGRPAFPFGTLVVNVVGSFVLGFLFHLGESRGVIGPGFRNFVFVGVIGAFTTFSTFSLETVNLLVAGDRSFGLINIIVNVVGCLGAIVLSRYLVTAIWG